MIWMDWLSLVLRWFHVIAGVAWIGASFYFIWLDNNLQTPPKWKRDKGIKGDLWAVHGGGFYEVAKYSYGPEKIPDTLHWFKWEAYTTWISGFALLVLIYYFGASVYLIDPNISLLTPTEAIIRGVGLIFASLALYELACRSQLKRYPRVFAILLLAGLAGACYLACSWFSGRGAYMHIGAIIGTIMAANVFLQIMPSQRLMVKAVEQGDTINPEWGAAAKLRSVHNNYFTLPLLFIMISNHYPMTYQHPQNYAVLFAIGITAAWIRHYFNLRHTGLSKPSILISGALAMCAIAWWVSMPVSQPTPSKHADIKQISTSERNNQLSDLDKQVQQLVGEHCVSCHAAKPSDPMFTTAPLGLQLDNWQTIKTKAALITQRTAITKDMPFLNKTNMSEKQRAVFVAWMAQLQPDN